MKKHMKWLAILATVAALSLTTVALTAGSGSADDPGLQDAIDAATAVAPAGAEFQEAELEGGRYEVEFTLDGQEIEFAVDANGEVTGPTTEDEDADQDD